MHFVIPCFCSLCTFLLSRLLLNLLTVYLFSVVQCPNCDKPVLERGINTHLDVCLSGGIAKTRRYLFPIEWFIFIVVSSNNCKFILFDISIGPSKLKKGKYFIICYILVQLVTNDCIQALQKMTNPAPKLKSHSRKNSILIIYTPLRVVEYHSPRVNKSQYLMKGHAISVY